jgi:hypothetical protein
MNLTALINLDLALKTDAALRIDISKNDYRNRTHHGSGCILGVRPGRVDSSPTYR